MDTYLSKAYSPALLASTLIAAGVAYGAIKFNTRVSPSIPYAGEQSLAERLQVPVEYGKDPAEFLRRTRKQIGDVFCVDLFAVKIVFFLGPEGNKAILRATEDKLSFVDQIRWAFGPVVYDLFDVPGWMSASFKFARTFFVKNGTPNPFLTHCGTIVDEHFEKWASQGSVPLFKSFSYLIISFLIVLLVGEDFYRKHGDEITPRMSQFERDMQHPILRVTPWSLWRFTAPGSRILATCRRFEELLAIELADLLAHPDKLAAREDYFAYIVQQAGDKYQVCYGRHVMTIIFGGHANIAMTMPWLFLHASRMPGALARIREETLLPAEVRRPFSEACVRETGRLYTNTTMMRMTRGEVSVAGHAIPPGTLVAASPLATQRADLQTDADAGGIYKDAGRWNPSRFCGPDSSTDFSDDEKATADPYTGWFQRAEFVQFGLGVHACPGEKLARQIIFDLVLKTWMQKYDVEVVSGLEEGMKGVDGVGLEAAWTEENFGTPSYRGQDPLISVKKRASV